jgi:sugar phosphate isomerase/epimerase
METTGHDSWTHQQALSYFKQCLQIQKDLSANVVHETHRQRLLHSPYQTRDLLLEPDLCELKINCDLSHWVVLCEHVFDAEKYPLRDSWWPRVLEMVCVHAGFIHARVGYDEGPQVPDPRDNKYAMPLQTHMQWWSAILKKKQAQGLESFYVEPEHGPEPYQIYPDGLSEEEKDKRLWDINTFIINLVATRYENDSK